MSPSYHCKAVAKSVTPPNLQVVDHQVILGRKALSRVRLNRQAWTSEARPRADSREKHGYGRPGGRSVTCRSGT